MTKPLRIVVLGYVVRCPLGGMAWHYLQFALGLARLGHEVWYLEDSEDHRWSCYNPVTHEQNKSPEYGLAFAGSVFARVGLGDRWAYHDAHTATWHGPCADDAVSICESADVFLNISGANPVRPWLKDVPCRVFIDTDPAFEQIRQLTVERRARRAAQHNAFFTFGENFGTPECAIPDDGLPWLPTRQPIVLSEWPVVARPERGMFTSVMQWDSYKEREYGGKVYGMKSKSFGDYIELPGRVEAELSLAIGSKSAPRPRLRELGWHLVDPLATTRDPWTYQAFLHSSAAEFSVAKHGYVVSRSGWFSERSAAYLASGRPVVAQDTGFGQWMRVGEGVLTFTNPDEAVKAIEAVCADYELHASAARTLAECYFDSDQVLRHLLSRAMSVSRAPACSDG